ncbi:hypothetical protein BpHYR1_006138, partial [Brachionus plicatilis]
SPRTLHVSRIIIKFLKFFECFFNKSVNLQNNLVVLNGFTNFFQQLLNNKSLKNFLVRWISNNSLTNSNDSAKFKKIFYIFKQFLALLLHFY